MNGWWRKIADAWPLYLAFAMGVFAQNFLGHVNLGGHPEMDKRMDIVERKVDNLQIRMNFYHSKSTYHRAPEE